jgi:hypothetical protein
MRTTGVHRGWVASAFVVALLAWGSTGRAATTIPYVESFEASGWSSSVAPWSGVAAQTAVGGGIATPSGSKGVSVTDNTLTLDVSYLDAGANYENVWCQVYCKPVLANSEPGVDVVAAGTAAAFYVDGNGDVVASDGAGWHTAFSMSPKLSATDWHGFAVHLNYSSGTYDIFYTGPNAYGAVTKPVNGATTLTMRPDRATPPGATGPMLSKVMLHTTGGPAYFDEVAVSPGFTGTGAPADGKVIVRMESRTDNAWKSYWVPDALNGQVLSSVLGGDLKAGLLAGDVLTIYRAPYYYEYTLTASGIWDASSPAPLANALVLAAGEGYWIQPAAARTSAGFYSSTVDPHHDAALPPQIQVESVTLNGATAGGWTHRVWTGGATDLMYAMSHPSYPTEAANAFNANDLAYVVTPGNPAERRYWNGSAWAKSGQPNSPSVPAGAELWFKRTKPGDAPWHPRY